MDETKWKVESRRGRDKTEGTGEAGMRWRMKRGKKVIEFKERPQMRVEGGEGWGKDGGLGNIWSGKMDEEMGEKIQGRRER